MDNFSKMLDLMEAVCPDYKKVIDARKRVNTSPTDRQKESGTYKKGHINILGFDISIENPKGSYRCGVDDNGKEWKNKMHYDYGYFKKTEGKDGDHIDVFIGPKLKNDFLFVVDQKKKNGEFDESKVMLGFDNEKEAKEAYLSNYSKDWTGFMDITKASLKNFKEWLYDGKKQMKPFRDYKEIREEK